MHKLCNITPVHAFSLTGNIFAWLKWLLHFLSFSFLHGYEQMESEHQFVSGEPDRGDWINLKATRYIQPGFNCIFVF